MMKLLEDGFSYVLAGLIWIIQFPIIILGLVSGMLTGSFRGGWQHGMDASSWGAQRKAQSEALVKMLTESSFYSNKPPEDKSRMQ